MFFLLGVGSVPGIGVANVCLALALACAIAWRLAARGRGEDFLGPFRRTTPLHAPIGAFVLLSVLSCFFSTLPSRSLIQIKGFGTFLLVVFVAALLDDEADVKLLVDAWRIDRALPRPARLRRSGSRARPASTSGSPGGLSVYMTYAGLLLVLVPLLGARGISGGSRGERWADVAVALGGALATALTLTRGAYVGLAIGLLAVLLAARPRLAFVAPFVVALFFVLMPLAVRDRLMSVTNPQDVTMNDRVAMWKAGRAMIADRPLFGVGPGRVKSLYYVYRQPGWVDPHPGHLHDNIVMIAAETGVPSALAYLAFVGAFFLGAVRIVRRTRRGGSGTRDRARGHRRHGGALFGRAVRVQLRRRRGSDGDAGRRDSALRRRPRGPARRLESDDVEPIPAYTLRRETPRRVTETQMSFGDAQLDRGPDATAMSVSQVIAQINGLLRGGLQNVWVRGEVSGFQGNRRPPGTVFFR